MNPQNNTFFKVVFSKINNEQDTYSQIATEDRRQSLPQSVPQQSFGTSRKTFSPYRNPASSIEYRVSGIQHLASGIRYPASLESVHCTRSKYDQNGLKIILPSYLDPVEPNPPRVFPAKSAESISSHSISGRAFFSKMICAIRVPFSITKG